MSEADKTKLCGHCGKKLPLDHFWKNRSTKDGLQGFCKECHSLYLHKDKDKELDTLVSWRYRHEDQNKLQMKRYRDKHPEKMKELRAKWESNNPDRVRAMWRMKYLVKTGKVVKPTKCTKCGREARISGYMLNDDDLSEVTWLCGRCGAAAHGRTKPCKTREAVT